MDHLSQGSIPFSWENRPGVCKDGQQNLAMESRSVVVHDNSHTKDEMRVSLHRNSSTKEGNTNKTIISHDIGLPLPPCAFHQPSLKSSSRRIKDDDPFLMAYKECTKSNKKGKLCSDLLEHMDKSWMNIVHRLSDPRYELGVMKFLDFAYRDKDRSLEIPCPCKICHNFRPQKKDVVYSHLMQKGISLDYIRWTEHGETSTSHSEDYVDDGEDDTLIDESDDMSDDDLDDMLDNIGQSTWGDGWKTSGKSEGRFDKDLETLHRLLDDSQQALYQGCPTYSKFSFAVTILHLKTTSGMSNRSFDVMLGVFRKALPTPSLVPKNSIFRCYDDYFDWNKLIDLISLMMNRATGKELLKEDGTQDESAIDRAEPQLQRPGRSIHVNPLYFEARQKLQQSNRVKTVVLNKPCNKGEYKTLHRRTYNSETNISATRLQSLRKQRMTRSKRTILDSILSEDVCIMPCKGINIFPERTHVARFEFTEAGVCHGFALWIDWVMDSTNNIVMSTGPEYRWTLSIAHGSIPGVKGEIIQSITNPETGLVSSVLS
ncbi:glycine-rich protein [Tanacetum coccineum]